MVPSPVARVNLINGHRAPNSRQTFRINLNRESVDKCRYYGPHPPSQFIVISVSLAIIVIVKRLNQHNCEP